MNATIAEEIRGLRKNSTLAYVGSIDEMGTPCIKAMFVLEHDQIGAQYFSTNYSSKRVRHFLKNPAASIYYCDPGKFKGALFKGRMEVLTDHDSKAALWQEGFEMYYPKGVDDEDYCVLKFTAEAGNYYHGLANVDFDIAELV